MNIYDLDRTSAVTWQDAFVSNGTLSGSSGSKTETERVLSLALLDEIIQNAIENGADYADLIFLMGHQQLTELKQLITAGTSNATWRMALEAQAPKGTNGVASEPGMSLDSRMGYWWKCSRYGSSSIVRYEESIRQGCSTNYLLSTRRLGKRASIEKKLCFHDCW
jgi:hypothetical protein